MIMQDVMNVNQYKEECLYTTNTTPESNEAREIRRLNQLLNEKDKEIFYADKNREKSKGRYRGLWIFHRRGMPCGNGLK